MTDDGMLPTLPTEPLLMPCANCGAGAADEALFHVEVSPWRAPDGTGRIGSVDTDGSEGTEQSACLCGRCQDCPRVEALEETYRAVHPAVHEPSAGLHL